MPASFLGRARKHMLRLVAVLVVAVGIPVIIAGPSSAHHPEITASADCAGQVSFTARSWVGSTPQQMTNGNIGVYRVGPGSSMPKIASGSFSAPGYSFSGTYDMGSATSVTLRVRADGPWASGAAGGDYRDVTVTAPTNCGTATVTNTCDTATVKLANTGASTQAFTVTIAGAKNETKTQSVAAGSTGTVSFPGLVEDGTYTVTVKVGTTVVQTQTFTVDCSKPTARLDKGCAYYTFYLDNTGSNVDTAFTVTVNGTSTVHTVAKGQTKLVDVPVTEGTTYTVKVTAHGATLLADVATVDCQKPAAVITDTCTGYTVTLDNTASAAATTFTVVVNGTATDHVVAKGETKTITKDDAPEGSSFDITVKHGADKLATKSFTIDCQKPAATVVATCTGYTVQLDNRASDVPVTFTVVVNGTATDHVVAKGETKTITKDDAPEGSSFDITVKHGTDKLATKTFTIDCEQPDASVSDTCTDYTAVLDNSASTVPVTFKVTVNGTATQHTVPARTIDKATEPVTEGKTYTVVVSQGSTVLATKTFTVDCEKPVATVSHTCTTWTAVLDNSASVVAVDFVVTADGEATSYEVKAGATKTVTGDVVDDRATTVTVSVRGEVLGTESFTEDCAKPSSTIASSCTGYTVTLVNTDSKVAVDFVVTINGDATTHTVEAGATQVIEKTDAAEGSSWAITVEAGGKELAAKTFTIDCEQPAATVSHTCTTWTAVLDNTKSTLPVTFTVAVNGGSAVSYVVPAGQTESVTGPVAEGASYSVVVKHGDHKLAKKYFTVDCEKPAATVTNTCTTWTAVLDNSASTAPVTFTVTVNGTATDSTVPAGEKKVLSGPVAEDSTNTVLVSYGSATLATSTFDIDCEQPAATIADSCTGYSVTLDNSASTVPVSFTVTVNGAATEHVVPAGKTETVEKTDATEGQSFEIAVTVGEETLATASFTIDCEKPKATIVNTCTTWTATLDNRDSIVPVTFTVTVNGTATDTPVPAGEKKVLSGPVAEDSTNTVVVSSGGATLATSTFDVNCQQPVATVVGTCTGYTVTLDNSASTVPVTFTVTVNGAATEHVVPAGKTETIAKTDATEGDSFTIVVANGATQLATATVTIDCVRPVALVAQSCAGYDVTLDNSASSLPVEFTVTVNGAASVVTVPAGKVQHVTGTVVEDSTNTITVRGGGAELVSSTFTQNCETVAPVAAVVHDCTTWTATLDNTGSNLPVEFTVTVNGAAQVVTVAAGQTQQVTGPVVEDTTYTVTVTGGGAQLTTGSFTVDCVQGGGGGGNGGGGNGGNGGNGGAGGNGDQGGDTQGAGAGANGGQGGSGGGTVTPASAPSSTGGLPATGSPALLGLALLLGLGLVVGGGFLVAGDRRRAGADA